MDNPQFKLICVATLETGRAVRGEWRFTGAALARDGARREAREYMRAVMQGRCAANFPDDPAATLIFFAEDERRKRVSIL